MVNLIPLFIAAGTVGIVHMAAPDHWVTLAILGRSKKWSRSKVFRTSLVTSIGHVLISLALGIGVAAIGIVFSSLVSGYVDTAIGILMLIVGSIVGIRPLVSKKVESHHHDRAIRHEHRHKEDEERVGASKLTSKIGYFALLVA